MTDSGLSAENRDFKMGDVEYEMVELLRRLNINRAVALTLVCLSKGEEISSRCIEVASGLRQPEVSIAMRYLLDNEWAEMREEKKIQSKGRPIKMYRLTVSMGTILNTIEEAVLAENRAAFENIERLKNLS